METADNRSYGDMLRDAPEFYNPSDVSNMLAAFGFDDVAQRPSLMRGLHRSVPHMNLLSSHYNRVHMILVLQFGTTFIIRY